MKEFFITLGIGIAVIFGIDKEEPEKAEIKQETHQEETKESVVEEKVKDLPPTVVPAATTESSTTEIEESSEETEKEPERVSDGQFEYEVPEDAPWWSPVAGGSIISESVQKGIEGQVSTLWGNGTQGQNERNMDHPRDVQIDSKGRIYFIDGSETTAKLRMFDGEKITTVIDLVDNKITRREGYFAVAGMVIMHGNVYVCSTQDLFLVKDGHMTQFTPKIRAYMDKKNLNHIYRVEQYKDYIYLMFMDKSNQYHIARYNTNGGDVEQVIETKPMPNPYNFYVHGENEIFIASSTGYVVWEILFPRETRTAWEDADPKTEIVDVWIGSNDSMYMVAWEDQTNHLIYENPIGKDADEVVTLAGSRRGFTDGIDDEAELDYPIDFVWDGSGYVFADMGSHSIRKVWTSIGPMKK